MIDVHCHLNFKSFTKDYDEVIKDAFEKGVKKIINVGTKLDSSKHAIELAEKYENLYAIVGVHPHHADKLEKEWLSKLEELAKKPKVVGIGETGIDYYRYKSNDIVDPKLQEKIFRKQIELSIKLHLPMQIHNRHAGNEIIEILKDYKNDLLDPPGMFHCISGNLEFLNKVLNMGFYIGFDGNITYKGLAPGENTLLSEMVKQSPLDRIVAETDSPFLTPEPHRGRRNSPSYVIITAQFIAGLKNVDFSTVERQTTINAHNLFKLK